MSSRNGYLTAEQRAIAPVLYRVLSGLADKLRAGSADYAGLQSQAVAELADSGFTVDYVAIRRALDLLEPAADDAELVVLAAANLGKARLIDNIEISR
jgi:pantoate--beta-alanine ligase